MSTERELAEQRITDMTGLRPWEGEADERARRERMKQRLADIEDEPDPLLEELSTRGSWFHVQHDQKAHGRRGVSNVRVDGSARDVHLASAAQIAEMNERRHRALGDEYDRLLDAELTRRSYTEGGYQRINGVARGGPPPPNESRLRELGQMDDALALGGVINSQSITVHRGLSGDVAAEVRFAADRGTGRSRIFTDDGFTSTSASQQVADTFSPGGNDVRLEITVPPGRRSLAGTDFEEELIFPRGTSLHLDGVSDDGSVVFATMT